MTTTEPTTTVPTAELDALRAIARAANVIAAGEHVDRHEHEQALDALPHLCDALAAETSAAAAHSAARDRRIAPSAPIFSAAFFVERDRARRVAAFAPHRGVHSLARTEDWLTRMGALGALSPDHQAAYEALAQAGVQPYQLRFLATAVSCGLIAPAERGTRP